MTVLDSRARFEACVSCWACTGTECVDNLKVLRWSSECGLVVQHSPWDLSTGLKFASLTRHFKCLKVDTINVQELLDNVQAAHALYVIVGLFSFVCSWRRALRF